MKRGSITTKPNTTDEEIAQAIERAKRIGTSQASSVVMTTESYAREDVELSCALNGLKSRATNTALQKAKSSERVEAARLELERRRQTNPVLDEPSSSKQSKKHHDPAATLQQMLATYAALNGENKNQGPTFFSSAKKIDGNTHKPTAHRRGH